MKEDTIEEIQLEYNNKKYHIVASRVYSGDIDLINKREGSIALIENDLKICNKDLEWVTIMTEDKIKDKNGVVNADDIIIDKDTTLTEYIDKIKEESNNNVESLKNELVNEKEKIDLKVANTDKEIEEIKSKNYASKEELDLEISRIEEKIESMEHNDGDVNSEIVIESSSKYIEIKEVKKNHYKITTERLEDEISGLRALIKELSGEESGFLGSVKDYDFTPITDNTKEYEKFSQSVYGFSGPVGPPLSIKEDAGLVKAFVKPDYNPYQNKDFIPISLKFEGLKETSVKNVRLNIYNEFQDKSMKVGMATANTNIRYENDVSYQSGDIVLPPKTVTKCLITVYTNPEAKAHRVYIKKLGVEDL